MDVNQLEHLMRNLAIKETRTNSLDVLESKLADVDQEIYEVMLCSESLFKFLADANSDQHTTASRIIYDKALEFYPNGSVVIDQFVERCLTHPKNTVKQFGLRGAAAMVYHSATISPNNIQLIILQCLPMKEVYVNTLMNVLIKSLPPIFTEAAVQKNLLSVLTSDETIRCRVYEIVCTIVEQHPAYLQTADPIIKRALIDLEKDDVLLQTSVLQILTQLLTTKEGYDYVEAHDLFHKVCTNFVPDKVTPYVRFVLPNALKFLASAALIQPGLFLARHPEWVTFMFDLTSPEDPMLMTIAYDCLGMVGSTHEGKVFLNYQKAKMEIFLKEFPGVLHSTLEAYKVRLIECLTNLLTGGTEPIDNMISSITQEWYETMTDSKDLELVHELFKVPFPNIKMAALKLLSAIVDHRWGQLFYQNTAGFNELLLNRRMDNDVNVAQFKFDVIKKLSLCTTLESFVANALKQYVSEGAFYRKAVVEVAIEGDQ
ncbi:26S proteasome non-ATPase regulatory subunit 5 isoform X1 [Anopheles moucheti]|uniref:26S proteasome non-ATPase regulatory subunit 5 isoform X1 n=1 Tax=Anopheles moucheti TaxID=186751 RepID=UPI0022F1316B|nr:26S proteasome non-ATPase regulatory subunit 5 isoform X1 [Anopheles moucheti]